MAIVAAYGMGSIPFGLLITRAVGLGDIRKIGSGSIGATNVLRTGRKELAVATLLLDALKGVFAVLIGAEVAGSLGVLACGLAAVIGHLFPVWLGFRGGKGVATGLGVLLAASPLSAAICGALWIAVALLTKISSASSLAATLAAPFVVWLVDGSPDLVILGAAVAVLLWAKHRANIARLLAGTEPRIGH